MSFQRVVQQTYKYGNLAFQGVAVTETGDTENQVQEIVPAGASAVFPLSVVAANAQALIVHVTPPTASVTTSAGDVLVSANSEGGRAWAKSSGITTPLVGGDATSITVDNTGGAAQVTVNIAILSEVP